MSLEQKLKLRVIKDEVKECTSMDDLKEQMIKAADLIMHYQAILNVFLKRPLTKTSMNCWKKKETDKIVRARD